MVPVVLEELELEFVRHVGDIPSDRIRLVAAEDEAADLLLEIGAAVGVADGGNAGRDAGDLLGDDVLVLDWLDRHADAGERSDLARPDTGGEHHLLAND